MRQLIAQFQKCLAISPTSPTKTIKLSNLNSDLTQQQNNKNSKIYFITGQITKYRSLDRKSLNKEKNLMPGFHKHLREKKQNEENCNEFNINPGPLRAQARALLWTTEENQLLQSCYKRFGNNWKHIEKFFQNRTAKQISQHWRKLNPGTKHHFWSVAEDQKLIELIQKFKDDPIDWCVVADEMPERNSTQVRQRYINHLSPHVNHDPWSAQEDTLLIELYKKIGGKWAQLTNYFKGRPENMLKNRFYNFIIKIYDPNKDFAQRDFSTNMEALTTTNTSQGPRAFSVVTPVQRGDDDPFDVSEFLNISSENQQENSLKLDSYSYSTFPKPNNIKQQLSQQVQQLQFQQKKQIVVLDIPKEQYQTDKFQFQFNLDDDDEEQNLFLTSTQYSK